MPSSLSVWGMQALVGLPSISTWQVPQAPSLHPSFTEVRCSSSRRKRMSFWFFSTVTDLPFTVNVAIVYLSFAPGRAYLWYLQKL